MVNPYVENANRWRELTEIDYFTYFIKAWIPFNAWFRNSIQLRSEREIINHLKNAPNIVRNRIVGLLGQNDDEGNEFRGQIARLHNRLESCLVYNKGERITFTNCYIGENTQNNQVSEVVRGITYSVERRTPNATGDQVLSIVTGRNQNQIMRLLQPRYDLNGLRASQDFLALNQIQQAQLAIQYQRVNPKIELNLLDNNNGFIEMGVYRFCNNRELVFSGLMEAIYLLRCVLFHGEIVPSAENNKVYDPAYHLLKKFLQTIA